MAGARTGRERLIIRPSPGTALAAVYLVILTAAELGRTELGVPDPRALASTPAGVAGGDVLPLLSSGLVVAGAPLPQLAALAIVAGALIRLSGAATFWRAAAAGHVGATVLAYAGVGVVWLLARRDVEGVIEAPDYGISCVWDGALGALGATVVRASHHGRGVARAVLGLSLATFVVALPFSWGLVGVEHVLALALGALVAEWTRARRPRGAQPVVRA